MFEKNANIWNHLYEFENDLADFLAANGLEAEPVVALSGSSSKRILLIKRLEEMPTLVNQKGTQLSQTTAKKAQDSKSIVTNLTQGLARSYAKGGKR